MPNKHWIIYANDVYGHMLAAIAERYIKLEHSADEIVYWPNETVSMVTHLTMPKDISKKDTIWMLGQSPTQRGMIDVKSETKPKKVYWYDYHISMIERIFEDKESSGIDKWPGSRTAVANLGQQMWTDLFPKEKIPPCIIWVDMFMQGKADATAKAFFYGLKLIETSPKELAKYPAVGEGENDPSNVWEACFQVNNPVDIENMNQTEDEVLTRMTWDATYQIINMGTIVDSYQRLIAQDLLSEHKFKTHMFEDGTRAVMVNSRDLDVDTVRDYFLVNGSAFPYCGWYYLSCEDKPWFDVTIIKLPEGGSAIDFAKQFVNAHGDDEVAHFRTLAIEFDHKHINKANIKKEEDND